MTEKNQEQKFIDNVKSTFNESVNNIDGATLSRLTQLRHAALKAKHKYSLKWIFVPAGALATALLVYVLVFNSPEKQMITADDIELISSSDSLEFYDDLEFYEWLDEYEQSS